MIIICFKYISLKAIIKQQNNIYIDIYCKMVYYIFEIKLNSMLKEIKAQ